MRLVLTIFVISSEKHHKVLRPLMYTTRKHQVGYVNLIYGNFPRVIN